MTVAEKPPMQGGGYKAVDCKDGWVIVRDVPSMSIVPKGVKNAPEDIGEDWMNDAVKFGQELYTKGKTAYPIHIGHNDDLGLTKPEFAGFFKPTRVGVALVEGKEKPAVFSDWKIKKSIFERFAAGELPYVSPEIRNWSKRRISSLALLDSQPPHFAFPIQTVSEVTEDENAIFAADLPGDCKIAKFEDGRESVVFSEFDPIGREKTSPKEEKTEKDESEHGKCCGHCEAYMRVTGARFMAETPNTQAGKPNSNPIDQEGKQVQSNAPLGNKMAEEVAMAAKFAAQADEVSALKKRLDERDAAEKAKALAAKALEDLRGYQIGEKTKSELAKFAAEGEEKLNAFVAAVKEVAVKDSPRTFSEAEAMNVSPNDPAVAKFAQLGPDKLEAAAKFAAEYRQLKAHPASKGMSISEEAYVKFQMESIDGSNGNTWSINVGSK